MPTLIFLLFAGEFALFIFSTNNFGFLKTLGFYFCPSLIGYIILTLVGRLALLNMQKSLGKGELPGKGLLHSGAIFLSGLMLILPTFTTRVIGLLLLLPGTRHALVWRLSHYLKGKLAAGASAFQFGNGHFSFTSGFGGFRQRNNEYGGDFNQHEREVRESNVVDVTPLKVTHQKKDDSEN